jgi:dCMP deaminase
MNAPEKSTHRRPSWDEYFMQIAELVGSRATCDRGRSGCVATKNKRILATGYVGAPSGVSDCDELGHEMHTVTHADGTTSEHCIRGTHAEQNVIAQAARVGVSLDGGTLYVHMTPCYACAKMIINSGIVRVIAAKDYHAGKRSKEVFKDAKVSFELLSEEMETYGADDEVR